MTIKQHWDLSILYKNDHDPAIARHRRQADQQVKVLVTKWQPRSDYLTKPAALAELLTDYEQWLDSNGAYQRELYYFDSRHKIDLNNESVTARLTQVTQTSQKLVNQTRFIIHRLAQIPIKDQTRLLASPLLKPYRNFLVQTFAAGAHLLTLEAENVLALKEQPAHTAWVALTEQQLNNETHSIQGDDGRLKERPLSEAMGMLMSHRQTVRVSAASFINQATAQHAELATAELNAILLNKQIDDELRGYNRPDAARLEQDQITAAMIDALTKAVTARNLIAHQLYADKARVLGVKKLPYHDRSFNPFPTPKVNYNFTRALRLTQQTFNRLDPQFGTILNDLATNGQIDVRPRKGKRGNAYCSFGARQDPIYILLNHTNSIRDVRVLAHEAGHAINFTLTKEQNALNYGVSCAIAETASTFFEDYIIEELLRQNSSPAQQKYLLYEKVSDGVATVHRQVALYRFEQELHQTFRQRGHLSQDQISDIFVKHMSAYMGPSVEQPASARLWWVHWPHIRLFFYTYSYASGYLISKILQQKLAADPAFIKQIKWLFTVGESLSPAEALAQIGLDITAASTWALGLDGLARDVQRLATLTAGDHHPAF